MVRFFVWLCLTWVVQNVFYDKFINSRSRENSYSSSDSGASMFMTVSALQGTPINPNKYPTISDRVVMGLLNEYHPCDDAVRSLSKIQRSLPPSSSAFGGKENSTNSVETSGRLIFHSESETTAATLKNIHETLEDSAHTTHGSHSRDWCQLVEYFDQNQTFRCAQEGDKIQQLRQLSTSAPISKSNLTRKDSYVADSDCMLVQRVVCGLKRPVLPPPRTEREKGNYAGGYGQPLPRFSHASEQPEEYYRVLSRCSGGSSGRSARTASPSSSHGFSPPPKGKALVLYMMHSWERDGRVAEWGNFAHFWDAGQGVLGPEEGTDLFDGVDYVFSRINKFITEPMVCSEYHNVKFVWVPPGPCDLCAHARIIHLLGFNESTDPLYQDFHVWPYRQVITLNSGTRGPFVNRASSTWIDLVSIGRTTNTTMRGWKPTPKGSQFLPKSLHPPKKSSSEEDAGGNLFPYYGRSAFWRPETEEAFRTIWSVAATLTSPFEQFSDPHLQSYFISIPQAALTTWYRLYKHTCVGEKEKCILHGELHTLRVVKANNLEAYSSLLRYTMTGPPSEEFAEEVLAKEMKLPISLINPVLFPIDPCRVIFIKNGGDGYNKDRGLFSIPTKTRKNIQRLSSWKRGYMTKLRAEARRQRQSDEQGREKDSNINSFFFSENNITKWILNDDGTPQHDKNLKNTTNSKAAEILLSVFATKLSERDHQALIVPSNSSSPSSTTTTLATKRKRAAVPLILRRPNLRKMQQLMLGLDVEEEGGREFSVGEERTSGAKSGGIPLENDGDNEICQWFKQPIA